MRDISIIPGWWWESHNATMESLFGQIYCEIIINNIGLTEWEESTNILMVLLSRGESINRLPPLSISHPMNHHVRNGWWWPRRQKWHLTRHPVIQLIWNIQWTRFNQSQSPPFQLTDTLLLGCWNVTYYRQTHTVCHVFLSIKNSILFHLSNRSTDNWKSDTQHSVLMANM